MLCWQVGRFSCIVPREGSGVFPFFSLRNGPVLPPPCRSEPEVCRMPAAAARAAARAAPQVVAARGQCKSNSPLPIDPPAAVQGRLLGRLALQRYICRP